MTPEQKHAERVVVLGAGMAGLSAVSELSGSGLNVLLVDTHNYTTFPPMLFYVATAFLSPEDVVRPVRALLPRRASAEFLVGQVESVSWDDRLILLADGSALGFSYLVLAPGAAPAFGAIQGASEYAVPMKSALDAARLRNTLLRSFEAAAANPQLVDAGATSVAIIGGGATGVEVAGYLADFLFRYAFPRDYPHLPRDRMRVCVLEAGDRLLPGLHPRLGHYALERLRQRGVDVRLSTRVAAVDAGGVTLASGQRVPAATVVWAAGVGATGLVERLGLPLAHGRIVVGPDLRVPGHPDTFAIGDAAAIHSPGKPLYPQIAQIALQTGRHAARQLRRLNANQPTQPFRYHDKGTMAMVGRNAAIIEAGRIRLTGFPAWMAWGALHLSYLPGIVNRLSAGQKFMLWHLTHDSSARILLEPEQHPPATPATPQSLWMALRA